MGILNRTPNCCYDKGATFALDDLVRRAGILVDEGADLLDVGGVKAGPGPEVGEAEELDRVIPAIEALAARFDIATSVDTWRASVAREAYRGRRGGGQRHQRVRRPRLPARRRRGPGASVVATHIRLGPRIPDPDPVYDDVVEDRRHVPGRASRPGRGPRGWPPTRSSSTPASIWARRRSSRWPCSAPRTGWPTSATPSSCRRPTRRSWASSSAWRWASGWPTSLAATSLGAALGCRVMRVHEVGAHRQACDVMAALARAGGRGEQHGHRHRPPARLPGRGMGPVVGGPGRPRRGRAPGRRR